MMSEEVDKNKKKLPTGKFNVKVVKCKMAQQFSPFRHFTISLFVFVAWTRVYRQKTLSDNQLVNSQKDPDFCAFGAVLSQFLSQK
jgi:hypothetical protein